MSTQKACDICRMARQRMVDGEPVAAVHRYTLRREMDQTRTRGHRGQRFQMSAGGIDLCDDCWERICKPRMRKKRNVVQLPPVPGDH